MGTPVQYAQGREIRQMQNQIDLLNRSVITNKLGIIPGGLDENFRPNSVRVSDWRVKPHIFANIADL